MIQCRLPRFYYLMSGLFSKGSRTFSSVPEYIHQGSEANFNHAFNAYEIAKEKFNNNNVSEARELIHEAIEYFTKVRGESPAKASHMRELLAFKNKVDEKSASQNTIFKK